jgi:hypothetical protein
MLFMTICKGLASCGVHYMDAVEECARVDEEVRGVFWGW